MPTSLAGKTVAILIASGVDEHQFTEAQRALIAAGAKINTIAPENGLVNGWQGTGWGHYHTVDKVIGEALGSDYDMLVIPGGERATAKLKQNLHTRRIVNHFMDANKPVAAIGTGVSLLALATRIANRSVAADGAVQAEMKQANAVVAQEAMMTEGNLLTATQPMTADWLAAMLAFADDSDLIQQAA